MAKDTKINFNLKTPSKNGYCQLMCSFTFNKRNQIVLPKIKVKEKQFNTDTKRLKGNSFYAIAFNKYLNQLESSILNQILLTTISNNKDFDFKTFVQEQSNYYRDAYAVNEAIDHETVINQIESDLNNIDLPEDININIPDYYEPPIQENNTLQQLTLNYINEKQYDLRKQSIIVYESVISILLKTKYHHTKVENFNPKQFRNILIKKGYNNASINGYIKRLKTVIKPYNPKHPIFDLKPLNLIKNQEKITLTSNEILQLYNHQFENKKYDKVKDFFVFSSLTGQRYQDYYLAKKNRIQLNEDSDRWLLVQSKTRKRVVAPLNSIAKEILKKYNYRFDFVMMSQSRYNALLKDIAKECKLNRLILRGSIVGMKENSKEIPLHQLINSHTAKRSFISNALANNVSIVKIQRVTGNTLDTLEKYIQISDDDVVNTFM